MVSIVPPDDSTTFIAAVLVPLLLGFLVGVVAKAALKIGAVIAAIILVLIIAGYIQPNQVLGPIVSLVRSGPTLVSRINALAGYLPYSSITFIIGLILGFLKG